MAYSSFKYAATHCKTPNSNDMLPSYFNSTATTTQDTANNTVFVWLISHQPTVLFSRNKSATSNQPTAFFSQNKSASATSHQPNEQAVKLNFTRNITAMRIHERGDTGVGRSGETLPAPAPSLKNW
jgi:hypothetical protein